MKKIKPEDIFLQKIKSMIKNLLVENKNYTNNFYLNNGRRYDYFALLDDTKERASYILQTIEDMEHLIKVK